jgi:hypothetical protein
VNAPDISDLCLEKFKVETSAKSHIVILSGANDLVSYCNYEILQSLRSLRMTGEGTFAEVSSSRFKVKSMNFP